MKLTGLFKFIKYFGSQQAAAKAIGVKQQAISNWFVRETIPYKQILKIVCATKGVVQPHELAPDDLEMNQLFEELLQLYRSIFPAQDSTSYSSSDSNNINIPCQSILSLNQKVLVQDGYNQFELSLPFCKQAFITLLNNNEGNIMTREYSKVSPQFWVGKTGREILKLSVESGFLAFYLMTCPHANMIGIYYLPIAYIAHDIKIDVSVISRALNELIEVGFCSYDFLAEHVWVHEMAKYQVCDYLEEKDKRVKGINDIFRSLPDLIFLEDFYKKYQHAFHLKLRREITLNKEINLTKYLTTPVVNKKKDPFEARSRNRSRNKNRINICRVNPTLIFLKIIRLKKTKTINLIIKKLSKMQ